MTSINNHDFFKIPLWIGAEIPCLYKDSSACMCGILSGEPVPFAAGYYVYQIDAINILEKLSPAASGWWEENGFPKSEDAMFVFDSECLEEMGEIVPLERLMHQQN